MFHANITDLGRTIFRKFKEIQDRINTTQPIICQKICFDFLYKSD